VGLVVAVVVGAGAEPAAAAGAWTRCPAADQRGFDCTTVRVPLDHARPHAAKIRLAVIRHRATDRAHRRGTLFFNPGGPGGPGTEVLPSIIGFFPAAVRKRFDLVSWDPRGVGASTAVQCFDGQAAEGRFLARLPAGFPVGAAEHARWTSGYAAFGRRCARTDPRLLRHVSTADTARDLDRLRRTVGDRRLNYLGYSYGTYLGATYANLFPRRVGRMVLDANMDPVAWSRSDGLGLSTFLRSRADEGAAKVLRAFFDLCGEAPTTGCAFSAGSAAATRAKWRALLARLSTRSEPVETALGPMTYAGLASAAVTGTYQVHAVGPVAGWAEIAEVLQEVWVVTGGDDGSTPVPQDRPAPSDDGPAAPSPARYAGLEQVYAIMCGESPNPPVSRFPALDALASSRAGVAGRYWTWLTAVCATWPVRAAHPYAGPWDRRTANPILVVGTTHDPATPYRGSVAMADELARARLLTVDGYGHGILTNPSRCASRHESAYLLRGALPPVGTRCGQDRAPFAGRP
jgi:pimeloyl-ACP methyl ester carboxylesterase